MGQPESKTELIDRYLFYPTDDDVTKICAVTDLDREEVHLYWDQVWVNAAKSNGKVDYESFVKHFGKNTEVSTVMWFFYTKYQLYKKYKETYLVIKIIYGLWFFLYRESDAAFEESEVERAFYLLDRDGDGWLEFIDFATYLFSTNERVIRLSTII